MIQILEPTDHDEEIEELKKLVTEGREEISQLNQELEELRSRLLETKETKLNTAKKLAKAKTLEGT